MYSRQEIIFSSKDLKNLYNNVLIIPENKIGYFIKQLETIAIRLNQSQHHTK